MFGKNVKWFTAFDPGLWPSTIQSTQTTLSIIFHGDVDWEYLLLLMSALSQKSCCSRHHRAYLLVHALLLIRRMLKAGEFTYLESKAATAARRECMHTLHPDCLAESTSLVQSEQRCGTTFPVFHSDGFSVGPETGRPGEKQAVFTQSECDQATLHDRSNCKSGTPVP